MSPNSKPIVGVGGGTVVALGTGAAVGRLPETGGHALIHTAVIALVGLMAWGIVYTVVRKLKKA